MLGGPNSAGILCVRLRDSGTGAGLLALRTFSAISRKVFRAAIGVQAERAKPLVGP